ncbi:hypothetical protein BJV82DRAFT_621708 [Fennellomyces sp. T-0311]|nr:hypothetical protein BJV82DRAFT_621708 [Fennellomyces sp. T-0311]
MNTNDSIITAVLWSLDRCMVSFYQQPSEKEPRKLIETHNLPNANLSYCDITVLKIAPPAVNRLAHLAKLNVQNNKLTSLPAELWQLTGLRELNIGKNHITHIPPDIARLVNLCEFYVHKNAIHELPAQVGRLKNLRVLDITSNKLTFLPSEVLELNLDDLWCDGNDFTVDPSWKPMEDSYGMPTKSSDDCEILSLRSVCCQTIGAVILDNPDQIDELQHSCLTPAMLEQLSVASDPVCAPRCSICRSVIFHDGLSLVHIDTFKQASIPFVYRACSQTCSYKVRTEKQDVLSLQTLSLQSYQT